MQIATSVADTMQDLMVLDAVQPMRARWYIYMKTTVDHATLVSKGITVAGRYIQLQSEVRQDRVHLVKVTLRDLPLHSVDNETVLETLGEVCQITSPVRYSNVWYQGRLTNIQNGDRYVYMEAGDASKLPDTLHIGEFVSCVVKPLQLSAYKHCGGVGHHAFDKSCPVREPDDTVDMVEMFRGHEASCPICTSACKVVLSRI